MRAFRSLVMLCLLSGLLACQGRAPGMFRVSPPADDPSAQAFIQAGDYSNAIRRYEALARSSGEADHYGLKAADTALRAGDTVYARALSASIDPKNLSPDDQDLYGLLVARLDLNEGAAARALKTLIQVNEQRLSEPDRKNYLVLRASALNQLGDMVESARERVRLAALLSKPEEKDRNQDALFETLGHLDPLALQPKAPPPDELSGWMELVLIFKTVQAQDLNPQLAAWSMRYPGHPAQGAWIRRHLKKTPNARPAQPPTPAPTSGAAGIGVLLPFSGPYASAAESIKRGMLRAQAVDSRPDRPELRFADTTQGPLQETITQLVRAGATALVGPLVKEDVARLSQQNAPPVAVLALNQTDKDTAGIYQFSLSPEEEIEQLVAKALSEGLSEALVLAPDTAFGQRTAQHFQNVWQNHGGRLVPSAFYPIHSQALETLYQTLPALSSHGFIFLIADPDDARTLVPRLRASQGATVYGLSVVFDGRLDEPKNAALDGLFFCEMPFLLNPQEGGPLSSEALKADALSGSHDAAKFLAMGLDAYRLLPQLQDLASQPGSSFKGATGTLSLGNNRRIRRQLDCARFQGSTPIPMGPAPDL